MGKKHNSNRAIFVLESPWELDDGDANRTSVLPFVEGIAKMAGDTEVLFANFYDKRSFKCALDCLCKAHYKNAIVYVAAHGKGRKVADIDIIELLCEIGLRSKDCNITGVMLGSCYVGGNTTSLEVCTEGTNLKWCAGYASTSEWFAGTLIDCSIIEKMSSLTARSYDSESALINTFANSITPFSPNFIIGNDKNENTARLRDSLKFVIQPSGQGRRAKEISDKVFDAALSLQSDSE